MRKRGLLSAVVLLILLLIGAGCSRKQTEELVILVHMLRAQQQYFETEIIPAFERRYNTKVRVVTARNFMDMRTILELDAKKEFPEISLVKTPFEITHQLAAGGYIQPLSKVVDRERLAQDMAVYHDIASAMGTYQGEWYYIPRKLESRILFYRKSMVADAIEKFPKYEEKIDSVLKSMNGFGLPAGYVLQDNPSEWDLYDIFVVGYIWAQEEYYGNRSGRIAQRADRYGGTALNFVDRAYQLNATADEILSMSGDAITEVFAWEKAFIDAGIYNRGMWVDRWRGDDIYNAVKDGKVFMATFQQVDCFNVHGWEGDPLMQSYLEDPSDMGLAVMPKGVSFSLDESGQPLFEGSRRVTTGGWWWGISSKAPQPQMAYEFARYITSRTWNAHESARFGMVPVRKDLLLNMKETYEMGWVGDIYRTSIDQINEQVGLNLTLVPRVPAFPQIGNLYTDMWYTLIEGGNRSVPPNREALGAIIERDFAPRAQALAGEAPEELQIPETLAE